MNSISDPNENIQGIGSISISLSLVKCLKFEKVLLLPLHRIVSSLMQKNASIWFGYCSPISTISSETLFLIHC